ncbi:MAG: glycosyltransferase family 39 protein [Planctomycetota bacterium]
MERLARREMLWLLVASIVAGAVRCVGLLEPSIWFDEAMSWRTSILPWDAMLRSLSRNSHPPLYFALLRLWVGAFGESAAALRSMNVVISMLTPPFIWLFCREAASATEVGRNESARREDRDMFRRAALTACLQFACSPFQIRLVWEARMYPLFVLLTMLSSWLLLRAIANPVSMMRWGCFAIASLGMLYTHYFAMFAVTGQFAFLACWTLTSADRLRKTRLCGVAVAAVIVVSGWALWLPVFLRQRQRVADDWWTGKLTLGNVLESAADWVSSSRVFVDPMMAAACVVALTIVIVGL